MGMEISVLASGSSGNSIYFGDGSTNVLIDAGLSGKELSKRLNKIGLDGKDIDAILVTHEHNDHITGVGVLSRRYNIPVYANELTWQAAASKLGKIKELNCKQFETDFMLGDFGIQPFSISHDAIDPVGYKITYKNKQVGIATDTGYVPSRVKKELEGVDFLIIESNHDLEMLMTGSYPWSLKNRIKGDKGHLSNDATAALLPELINSNHPCILLAHLSKDNNVPDLAYLTIKNNLEEQGFKIDRDLELDFTYRNKPTKLYQVG